MICIALPIVTLVFLDYFNLEGYNYGWNPLTNSFDHWPNAYLNQNFTFDMTWKGRLFYPIFLWLLVLEAAMDWNSVIDFQPRNRRKMAISIILALIPMVYVLATNFFGLDLVLLKIGRYALDIHSSNADLTPSDFLHLSWPLSVEYLVFAAFFMSAIWMAYKLRGLKIFSISFALLGGIGVAYMLDTIFPFGVFKPLQELALPTSATAAALFDVLGYNVTMNYPVHLGESLLPSLTVTMGAKAATVSIAWACAGSQSLFLYVLIMAVFLKKTSITAFRKLSFFIIGLFGTFFVNVLRIFAIVVIMIQQGNEAGMVFHNTYGELFSFMWIFLFILLVVCIERFMLVERTRGALRRISSYLGNAKNKLASKFRSDAKKLPS
jgi:thaumarchaeosortase